MTTLASPVSADPAFTAAADQINRGLFDFISSTLGKLASGGGFPGGFPMPGFGGREVGGPQPGYGGAQPGYGGAQPAGQDPAAAQRGLLDAVGVALPAIVDAFPKILAAWQQGSRSTVQPNPAELTRGWTDALMKLAPHVINGTATVLGSWLGRRDIRRDDLDAQSAFVGEYTRTVMPALLAAMPSALDDLAPGSRAMGEERNERWVGAALALAPTVIDLGTKLFKKFW